MSESVEQLAMVRRILVIEKVSVYLRVCIYYRKIADPKKARLNRAKWVDGQQRMVEEREKETQ